MTKREYLFRPNLHGTRMSDRWRFVPVFVVLASLIGCVSTAPTKRIVAFSEATDLVTDNVNSSFSAIDQAYFDAQVARVASGGKDALEKFQPSAFNTWIPEEDLEVRRTLLKGLAKYAGAISDVMSDNQLNEFDKETKDLGEQLKSLSKTDEFKALAGKREFSESEVTILATAINAIGRWFINYKRGETVKEVIADTDPHVKQITEFLRNDFEAMRTENKAAFNQQLMHLHGFIVSEYDKFEPIERYEHTRRLAHLVRQQRTADQALSRAAKSMSKLAETHGKLHEAFNDDAFDLEASIRGLINEGKHIKEFYDKLKSDD